ncbi:MAG: hypothetical protein ACM3ZC_00465 [Bacteroidota bacterium]
MTVFGLGRLRRRKSLTLAPARFTIGFAESGVDAEGAIGEIVRDMA